MVAPRDVLHVVLVVLRVAAVLLQSVVMAGALRGGRYKVIHNFYLPTSTGTPRRCMYRKSPDCVFSKKVLSVFSTMITLPEKVHE